MPDDEQWLQKLFSGMMSPSSCNEEDKVVSEWFFKTHFIIYEDKLNLKVDLVVNCCRKTQMTQRNIIKETFRLHYPAGMYILRQAIQDCSESFFQLPF